MPVANVSCGAGGGTCCLKGALPPADASADADASDEDECTPKGMVCQDKPTCEADFQPVLGVSCGAAGKTCCVKGALPPKDAAAD